MLHPWIEPRGNDLTHFAAGVARGPLDELLGHAIGMWIARLADVVEQDLHGALMGATKYNSKSAEFHSEPPCFSMRFCSEQATGHRSISYSREYGWRRSQIHTERTADPHAGRRNPPAAAGP